jgi:hypothetical protein
MINMNMVNVHLVDGQVLSGIILEVLEDNSIWLRREKHISFLSSEIISKITVIDLNLF